MVHCRSPVFPRMNPEMSRFLANRILQPIKKLLASGMNPRDLAIAASLGIALGTFPVIGLSSILCTIAALAFRLNLPVIQLANWIASPIQLAFIVPFLHLGSYLFGAQETSGSLDRFVQLLTSDWWGTIGDSVTMMLHGIVAWLLIAPLMAGLVYIITLPVLRRFASAPVIAVAVPADTVHPQATMTGAS